MHCHSPGSPRTAEEDDSNDESLPNQEYENCAERLLQKLNAAGEEWKLYTRRRRRRHLQLK